MQELRELEGTGEEIVTHAEELAGRRVRLTVLPTEPEAASPPFSSARSLLRYAGSWSGEDLEQRLKQAYDHRLPTEF